MANPLGMSKHRTMGHTPNEHHFTGRKGGCGRIKRKSSTKKSRELKMYTHVNKYKSEKLK